MSRIGPRFEELAREGRRALMMYVTIGHPTRDAAIELVPAIVEAGADIIELGVPFSDPLADGATVQHATEVALRNGVNVRFCLETVRKLRAAGITVPLVLMGYYNPMLQYGLARFCADAQAAGVDGLIVPDLPPEESYDLEAACRANDMDLIFMLAPTSTTERIREIAPRTSGFIYCVALTGTTGARAQVSGNLPAFLERVRAETSTPLAVGFGISEPRHAQSVAEVADGVIVGSALLNVIERAAESGPDSVRAFVASMREGTDRASTVQA